MRAAFRVEHETTHKGPFQTPHPFTQELAERASHREGLKAPGQDGILLSDLPYVYVFGSPDLPMLARWFLLGESVDENADIVRKLDELGYVVAEYRVKFNESIKGDSGTQLAFNASEARYDNRLVRVMRCEVLLEHEDLATN